MESHRIEWMADAAIELLSVEALGHRAKQAEYFRKLSRRLVVSPGWHYLLDWIWLDQHLRPASGARILDAGAGIGLMQWHLAAEGAHVVSVDRSSRAHLPYHLRHWYSARGLRPGDLRPFLTVFHPLERGLSIRDRLVVLGKSALGSVRHLGRPTAKGLVSVSNQELASLTEVKSESIDAVIAVSSLEHNPPERLEVVIRELWRVLCPGGVLLATMSAANERDWYHAPSRSHCYTESSLRRLFNLPGATRSNFAQYESIMGALRDCAELRRDLPRSYFRSGENGMPWGVWDPVYIPVGIAAVKSARTRRR